MQEMDKNKAAIDIFNKNAERYQERAMKQEMYHDSYDIFCNSIGKEQATVLDVACGPGNITQYLLNRRPDLQVLGIDLAPNMLNLARANNPTAVFQLMDGREINAIGQTFDGIICGFGLPYFSREEAIKFIGDAAKLLHRGGALYISTMEDDYGKSGPMTASTGEQAYMYYHQPDYLVQALQENDLTLLELQRKEYPGKDGEQITDLIIIAGK